MDDERFPLRHLCEEWVALLGRAEKVKEDLFGQYAKEAMMFYDSAHNFMWKQEYAFAEKGGFLEGRGTSGFPTFRMSVNRVFEAVALYGPSMYHRNPNILVIPKAPPQFSPEELGINPEDEIQAQIAQSVMLQQAQTENDINVRAKLNQHYLNWVQQETDKKRQARRAIDEAVIKGMGCLWTGVFQPPHGGFRHPRSQFVSCDDILKDPDARYREDVEWIARRCVHPVNRVEEKYDYPEGTLKGTLQSLQSQSTNQGLSDKKEQRDTGTHDLIEYWEIYSKNGMGQRIKATNKNHSKTQVNLDEYGKYCYLAVAKGFPFPLNLPPDRMSVAQAHWPVPYWYDDGLGNGWPFAELGFYENPDNVWPISLVKPGIGELRFINWCMSFLADKVAANCTSYIGVVQSAAKAIEEQILNKRGPFKTIELTSVMGQKLSDIISFIQAPDFSKDIWTMLSEVMDQFDKRTGLTELLYGQSNTQLRSAEEARVKNQATSIRPDEMASCVEDWMSQCAMKEMECAVYTLSREDVEPVLGQIGAQLFEEKVLAIPFERTVQEFDYRVEAGSARKPNKANKVDQLTQLGQVIAPVLQQFAIGGQVGPWNAYARDLTEALDLDPDQYILQEPPVEPQQGLDPQAELELEQAKLGMKQQTEEAKLEMQREKTAMELQAKAMEMQMDAAQHEQEMAFSAQEQTQDLALQRAKFSQESQMQRAEFEQDSAIKQQQAHAQMAQAVVKTKGDIALNKAKQQAMKAAKPVKKPAMKPKGKK